MKTIFKAILIALLGLMFNASAFAASGHGSADEAKAMVKKAALFLKSNGKDKTFEQATNQSGQFVSGDLYLSIYDTGGKVLAHGANAKLVGKDVSELKDADDKYFIKEILAVAKKDGSGWVDYKWPNPVTKEIQGKTVYFEQVNNVIIACGFYKA